MTTNHSELYDMVDSAPYPHIRWLLKPTIARNKNTKTFYFEVGLTRDQNKKWRPARIEEEPLAYRVWDDWSKSWMAAGILHKELRDAWREAASDIYYALP